MSRGTVMPWALGTSPEHLFYQGSPPRLTAKGYGEEVAHRRITTQHTSSARSTTTSIAKTRNRSIIDRTWAVGFNRLAEFLRSTTLGCLLGSCLTLDRVLLPHAFQYLFSEPLGMVESCLPDPSVCSVVSEMPFFHLCRFVILNPSHMCEAGPNHLVHSVQSVA